VLSSTHWAQRSYVAFSGCASAVTLSRMFEVMMRKFSQN
jgi:hypothetical protein